VTERHRRKVRRPTLATAEAEDHLQIMRLEAMDDEVDVWNAQQLRDLDFPSDGDGLDEC
jgi:hypothetical protein